MKPAPTFVESGFLYESAGRDPLLLGHATLTVDSDRVWRIRQVWRTGWCQTETTRYEYTDEAEARAQMAYIYAYGEPLGTWRKRQGLPDQRADQGDSQRQHGTEDGEAGLPA